MKYIKGYNKRYMVTKDGKVWSNFSKRFLKTQIGYTGYPIISLGTKVLKNKNTFYIHRLVAKSYIPEVNGKNKINHKNGIKTDNRVENLEWCTQKENIRHAWKNGFVKPKYNLEHQCTKLSLETIKEIKTQINNKYGTLTRLANKYNVSISLISLIKRGYRT